MERPYGLHILSALNDCLVSLNPLHPMRSPQSLYVYLLLFRAFTTQLTLSDTPLPLALVP